MIGHVTSSQLRIIIKTKAVFLIFEGSGIHLPISIHYFYMDDDIHHILENLKSTDKEAPLKLDYPEFNLGLTLNLCIQVHTANNIKINRFTGWCFQSMYTF